MFRTADGAGVQKIYLTGYSGKPPRKEITKTALGAEKIVPWEYRKNPVEVIGELKKQGFVIIALEQAKGSVDYRDLIPTFSYKEKESAPSPRRRGQGEVRIALLVGNEVRGVSPVLLKHADHIIHIPMRGKKESLNVSVAFGIAVYELMKQYA